MSKRIASSKEIWEKDRRHHVHPFHNFVSYNKNGSLIMDKGRGAYIQDIDGKEYFDAVGGMWCTNIGLGRQEMADLSLPPHCPGGRDKYAQFSYPVRRLAWPFSVAIAAQANGGARQGPAPPLLLGHVEGETTLQAVSFSPLDAVNGKIGRSSTWHGLDMGTL